MWDPVATSLGSLNPSSPHAHTRPCVQDKQSGGSDEEFDTLKNLTAFLTLSKAEEKGFKPSDFNLSDQEAGSIATVFSRYDTNDDMMLEQSEVSRLLYAPREPGLWAFASLHT